MFKNLPRLQEEVATDPGMAAAPVATPAAPPAASSTPSATPTATPAATPASSLSAAAPDPNAWIPEKMRVMKEDGTLDQEASFRKTTESYSNLEKRFGSGDVPPATAEEYKLVGLPETVKVEDIKADPGMKSFLQAAHAKGMTDAQVTFAINQHVELLHNAGYVKLLDQSGCDEYLSQVWIDDKTFSEQKAFAFTAAEALGKKAGISIADMESSGLANNPLFIRMLASIGPEIGEDRSAATTVTSGEAETIESLMRSAAYLDPKHPEHKVTGDKVRAFYQKKFGDTPVG